MRTNYLNGWIKLWLRRKISLWEHWRSERTSCFLLTSDLPDLWATKKRKSVSMKSSKNSDSRNALTPKYDANIIVLWKIFLKHCFSWKLGTEFIRGVSGGEKKRTSIGMEMIVSPNILFLDEPTTGLDANTAGAVMSLLHRWVFLGCVLLKTLYTVKCIAWNWYQAISKWENNHILHPSTTFLHLQTFPSVNSPRRRSNSVPRTRGWGPRTLRFHRLESKNISY